MVTRMDITMTISGMITCSKLQQSPYVVLQYELLQAILLLQVDSPKMIYSGIESESQVPFVMVRARKMMNQ